MSWNITASVRKTPSWLSLEWPKLGAGLAAGLHRYDPGRPCHEENQVANKFCRRLNPTLAAMIHDFPSLTNIGDPPQVNGQSPVSIYSAGTGEITVMPLLDLELQYWCK